LLDWAAAATVFFDSVSESELVSSLIPLIIGLACFFEDLGLASESDELDMAFFPAVALAVGPG